MASEPEGVSAEADEVKKSANALTKFVRETFHEGIGRIPGATTYANDRLWRVLKLSEPAGDPRGHATEAQIEKAIARIITESRRRAGTAGAITGVGGVATSLVLLPANLVTALVINARMVGAIAHLRGYTLRDPLVENFIVLLAGGSLVKESLQASGVKIGGKVSMKLVAKVPASAIKAINNKAGISLVAKYGTKRSAVTVSKAVPLVGAVVGGAVDAGFTTLVARRAKTFFEYTPVRHLPATD